MGIPTLDEAKAHLGVDFTDDDLLIGDCIAASQKLVEDCVGASLNTTESLTAWSDVGYRFRSLRLFADKRYEFHGITKLHIRGINTDDGLVEYETTTGFIARESVWHLDLIVPRGTWDAFDEASAGDADIDTSQPVQIAFSCGIADADIPADWKMTMLLIVGELYENRGNMPEHRRSIVDVYLSRIAPRM